MRNLILRLLLFIAVYITAGHLIKSMMPYYWGNPWWSAKMRIIERSETRPTVYFIGSSRTYRHIIPTVFDSVLTASGVTSRSFNLGAQATFTPQTYHLLERAIVSKDLPKGSTVFLDFMDTPAFETDLTSSARNTYWIDTKEISFIIKSYLECQGGQTFSSFLGPYLLACSKNTFHISQFKGLIGEHESQYEELDRVNSAGFLSLSKEYSYYPERADHLRSRFNKLRSDTSVIATRKNAAIAIRSGKTGTFCPVLMDRISALDVLCTQNDIELIHLLPPTVMAKNEWAAFEELPKTNRIDMGDPRVFSEFYRLENMFDKGHLNEQGAHLYTIQLAREFIRLRAELNEN